MKPMKRRGDFYSLAADIAELAFCAAPVNIHTAAVSAVTKTAEFIKNMPISPTIKNRCPSSGQPLIVEPTKGRIGCPEEGCWAWWQDVTLVLYPEHVSMSLDDAQNQALLLNSAEHFRRDVIGCVEIAIPRRPIPSATLPTMLLQPGLFIQPAGKPIEIAKEHVPMVILEGLIR